MTFTSYAQNFEDVMLWRALSHVAQGCYVDIGAQHPVIDSVSLAFYERGWRGVHVEPVPMYADLLRLHRPDETVLQTALGDVAGTVPLRVIPDTGLSTIVADYAEQALRARGMESHVVDVPVQTMHQALSFLQGRQVHWMKIDVEGFESQVLRGWDSSWLRPWLLVIEAVLPGGTVASHQQWEPIVLAAGYTLVYADGLNRFYCSSEHPELVAAFAVPPNVADDIRLTRHSSLMADVNAAHDSERREHLDLIAGQKLRIDAMQSEVAKSSARAREVQRLAGVIHDMQASRSWRLTAPLRHAGDLLRKLRRARREGRLVTAVMNRLRRTLVKSPAGTEADQMAVPPPLAVTDLSPRALAIHQALVQARKDAKGSRPTA